jgi:hypothetical protein
MMFWASSSSMRIPRPLSCVSSTTWSSSCKRISA